MQREFITKAKISTRLMRILLGHGYVYIDELQGVNTQEMLRWKKFGKALYVEFQRFLSSLNSVKESIR